MAQKRKLIEEFESVSDAKSSESATVHGLVASVSPMKPGKRAKYFDAKLTDGAKHLRIVGFQGEQRVKLADFQEGAKSVALLNCEVKKARQSEELEVILKSASRVESSPKKFEGVDISAVGKSEITLDELYNKNTFDRISVDAKAVRVGEPVMVSGGIKKQDVTIADSKSAAKVTLWQNDIGRMLEGKSYRLSNVVVRCYQSTKYLSMPKEGGLIIECDDLGDVVESDVAEDFDTIEGAEVVGVLRLDSYPACIAQACKSKVAPTSGKLGCCSKCEMVQIIGRCKMQLSAKVVIAEGEKYHTLNVFGTNVSDIAQEDNVSVEALISAPPFTLTYENNVITSIRRC